MGWRRLAVVCLWLAACLGQPLFAENAPVSEYALKSALLFKLPKFVYRPPAERNGALAMCLLGSNPFGNALEKLAEVPIDGQPVRYIRLEGVGNIGACDFVFISRSEAGGLESLLRRIGSHQVVTVSDIEGFARAGGMVELARGGEGAPISILINRRAAQRQSIEFNAQLLRLANLVEP